MIHQSMPAVLIVEDELIVASDLQQSLDEMGYDAFAIAASGEEAVACASERRPDIVLMDIRIKGENDGIQTAELLKKRFPVIVIFLTAYADSAIVDRAKRVAPDGYLVKPVKSSELRSTIEVALYRRELDGERERLRAMESRLHAIADNVPIAIAYFDPQGTVQFANDVFRSLMPYKDNPIGLAAMTVMGEKLYRESYPSRQLALLGDQAHSFVDWDHGGERRKFEVSYLPDRDSAGMTAGVYAIAIDVTEREIMSAELRQAQLDLETILNAVPAGISSWRMDLTNRFANKAAEAQFGLSEGATLGRPLREVFGEKGYQAAKPFILKAFAGQRSSQECVGTVEDGSTYHRIDYIPEINSAGVAGLYVLSLDISEIRRSHEEVRQLAQRLDSVREEERRSVSVILHDGIAQDLFALKLGLDHLEGQVRHHQGVESLCKELRLAVAACMEDIRQIANELRPAALANFPISAVLAQHIHHFGTRANLDIHVVESDRFPALDEATQLLFFRAAQEALTNVARHARAAHVEVALLADPERITLTVTDDGIGFDDAEMRKSRSLGLLGLRERFQARGGGLSVTRNIPKGTILSVYLPNPASRA